MLLRIWNLVIKEFNQLRRDRVLVPFLILGPMLELVMVAYSTSAGIHHLPTAVIDLDHSPQSRAFILSLQNLDTFSLKDSPGDQAGLQALFDRGAVSVGLVIPPGFGAAFDRQGAAPQLQVILDGSEPSAAQAALRAIDGQAAAFGAQIRAQTLSYETAGGPQLAETRMRVRFNEELKESNYTVPSEMGFMLSAITMMVASLGIARERELGTLEQLMVTPLRPLEMVIGKAIPAIILSYLVFLLMLFISLVGFGVPMRGSWPLLLSLAAFYLFVELGWGIMASAISHTQLQALLIVFVFVMVEIVFSGYAFPVENMPRALQIVANLFPIKHWLIIFRSILLKGAGPWAYWRELIALPILGVGILGSTVIFLRRQSFA